MADSEDNDNFKFDWKSSWEKHHEWILLTLFFASILVFASIFDSGLLIHKDAPENLNAGDMFIFSSFGDLARYSNDMKIVPPYLSGNQNSSLNFFSPLSGIVIAQLSNAVGSENYDFVVHLNLFFLIMAMVVMYLLLRKIDKTSALLSLPIFLLVFKWPFNFIIQWGGHIGNFNIFLVVITLYCFLEIRQKFMFLILGLVNTASFLSHGREFQTLNIAFAIYFIIIIIKDKTYNKIFSKSFIQHLKEDENLTSIKNFVYSVIITTIFIFPWWPALSVFGSKNIGDSASAGLISGIISWGYNPLFHQVKFSDFGIFLIFIILSLILGMLYIYSKYDKKLVLMCTFSLVFFFSGIFIILGNAMPQARAFYVITLMPIITILFLNILGISSKSIKIDKYVLTSVFFVFLIIIAFYWHKPQSLDSGSLVTKERMDSFKWVKNNLKDNSTILMFYGDIYRQKSIFTLMRHPYHVVDENDIVNNIKELKIRSSFKINKWVVHERFTRENGKVTADPNEFITVQDSLCSYRYIYFDKQSESKELGYYSKIIAESLIKGSGYSLIYENNLVIILENKNHGKCFADELLKVKGA